VHIESFQWVTGLAAIDVIYVSRKVIQQIATIVGTLSLRGD
jgi:hypothetical protein